MFYNRKGEPDDAVMQLAVLTGENLGLNGSLYKHDEKKNAHAHQVMPAVSGARKLQSRSYAIRSFGTGKPYPAPHTALPDVNEKLLK